MGEMWSWSNTVCSQPIITPVDFTKACAVASEAFASLAMFNRDTRDFRNLLIQMALSSGTITSRAVLFALLAVSSKHRHGPQERAFQFKASAVAALAKSAENGSLDTIESVQHVAAGMLLCSFEVSSSLTPRAPGAKSFPGFRLFGNKRAMAVVRPWSEEHNQGAAPR